MPRSIESSEHCNAWVVMGDTQAGAILSCKREGNGLFCLKDMARKAGLPDVSILIDVCFVDERDGTVEPLTPMVHVNDILEHETSEGLGIVLGALQRQRAADKPE